jgi:hypothetical protein
MSEKLSQSGERSAEAIDTSAESQKLLEKLQEKADHAENDPIQKHIESLSKSVEQQAISGKEVNVGDKTTESAPQTFGTNKQLKADSYKRALKRVRTDLNVPERTLSRVVHQKTVESVSNVAAKTVARPSALLGGGIGAFVGSAILLYISHHSGFTYNYTVIFVLFIGGFFAGSLAELIIRVFVRKRSS